MSEKEAKILIIDDKPSEVKMVKMALERANYKVIYAYDGKEGIEMAIKNECNLILTDIRMLDIDGMRVLWMSKDPNHPSL